jgi:hypothetical protein
VGLFAFLFRQQFLVIFAYFGFLCGVIRAKEENLQGVDPPLETAHRAVMVLVNTVLLRPGERNGTGWIFRVERKCYLFSVVNELYEQIVLQLVLSPVDPGWF